MKKVTLFAFAALMVGSAHAQRPEKQSSVYVRAGIGYSMPLGGAYTHTDGLPINGTGTELIASPGAYSFDINKASFGSGVSASAGFGCMFNKHVGVDLGVNIGVANRKYEYEETSSGSYIATRTSYAKLPVLIMPSLVLATGGERVNVYSRIGVVAAVAGKIIAEDYFAASPNSRTAITETKNKLSVGFTGTVGGKFYVADGLALSAELTGTYLDINAKSSEVTEWNINGVNYLSTLTISERSTVYSEKFVIDALNPSPDVPTNMQPVSASFSNVGIAIGVCIEM